jgi:translation elongation factor EF-1beta
MIFIGLGVLCIGYGIYTGIVRVKSPEKLGKYDAMKERFGNTAGKIIHTISYTVLPIVFGIIMILKELIMPDE